MMYWKEDFTDDLFMMHTSAVSAPQIPDAVADTCSRPPLELKEGPPPVEECEGPLKMGFDTLFTDEGRKHPSPAVCIDTGSFSNYTSKPSYLITDADLLQKLGAPQSMVELANKEVGYKFQRRLRTPLGSSMISEVRGVLHFLQAGKKYFARARYSEDVTLPRGCHALLGRQTLHDWSLDVNALLAADQDGTKHPEEETLDELALQDEISFAGINPNFSLQLGRDAHTDGELSREVRDMRGQFPVREFAQPRLAYAIDFYGIGPSIDGYVGVLSMIDLFSRWLTFIPVKDNTAATAVRVLLGHMPPRFVDDFVIPAAKLPVHEHL